MALRSFRFEGSIYREFKGGKKLSPMITNTSLFAAGSDNLLHLLPLLLHVLYQTDLGAGAV